MKTTQTSLLLQRMFFHLLLFSALNLHGQTSVNSGGSKFQSSEGSIDYSIGQLFINEWRSDSMIETFGIQIPIQEDTLSGLNEWKYELFQIYPNPFGQSLQISSVSNMKIDEIELVDIQGKLVFHTLEIPENNCIDLSHADCKSGIYFIRIRYNLVQWDVKKIISL